MGTDVAKYGGTIIRGEEEFKAHMAKYPSTKLMEIRSGDISIYIDACGDKSDGGMANHACGATLHCPANVTAVHDDQNRDDIWLVADRDIKKGEWIFLDYGIVYDIGSDLEDPTLNWLRDYVCPVCTRINWDEYDGDAEDEQLQAVIEARVVDRLPRPVPVVPCPGTR